MSERGSLAAKRVLWLLLVALLAAVAYAGRAQGGDPPEDALYLYSTAISGIASTAGSSGTRRRRSM